MHNNNNRFIEGRNLHLDCSLLSIHARMSRNSRFDPLSREIKPPLPLLSITMRKSLGEKVAWRGGKRLKSDEKSSGPVFESRKSKKKRERERDRGIRCQCFLDTDEIPRFLPGCVLSRWITQDDIGLLRTSVCVPRNPRRDRVGPVPNCFRSLYRCFANGRLYDDLVEIDDKQIFRWKAFEPLLSSISLSLIDSLTRLYI